MRDLTAALHYTVLRGWQDSKVCHDAQQEKERQQALIEKNYSDGTRRKESLQK